MHRIAAALGALALGLVACDAPEAYPGRGIDGESARDELVTEQQEERIERQQEAREEYREELDESARDLHDGPEEALGVGESRHEEDLPPLE